MALIFPEHWVLNEQNIDITNSPIIKLRDDPQQSSFHNIPYKDVTLLFIEGSKTEDEASPFSIPVNNIWGRTYAANREELDQFLLSPHLHIPRIFFSIEIGDPTHFSTGVRDPKHGHGNPTIGRNRTKYVQTF